MKKSILFLSLFLIPLALTAADLKADLEKAMEKDDIAAVKKLIIKGADVNAKDRYGWTPVIRAALANDLDTVRFLIEKGADVRQIGNNGATAFYFAASRGNLDLVELIYSADPKLNIRQGVSPYTPMDDPAGAGNIPVVEFLLNAGYDVNEKLAYGARPIMYAAEYNHLPLVKFLLEKGADIEATGNLGENALMLASQKGHLGMVKYLVDKGANVNAKSAVGYNPLRWAACGGHT